MKEEQKKTILSIVEELRKEEKMTNSRMLTIQNSVRKSLGLEVKKFCPTNKQRLVELLRNVLGENLIEIVTYNSNYGEGRKPTEFSIRDYEKALSDIENYFSKKEEKVKKVFTEQKKIIISKLLSILTKVSESDDHLIRKDLLSELIDAKTPVSGTLKNWSDTLKREGIELSIKTAGRGIYKVENIEKTKEKLEDLYEKLTTGRVGVKKKKTETPVVIKEYKELNEEEERIVFLIAEKCNHKEVPYSQIWGHLKRQGYVPGFDMMDLIKRAGLKKWFIHSFSKCEHQLKFIGKLDVVGALMGQEVEKTILVRSSLELNDMKSIIRDGVILKSEMPDANIYSIKYSESRSSMFDLLKLKMSFRGYDGFIEEEDEKFVDNIINDLSKIIESVPTE